IGGVLAETLSDIRCRFRWHGGGWRNAIDTVVIRPCVVNCGGHNRFAFVLVGDVGSRQADRTPESMCSGCGNRVGLTNAMLKEVFKAADEWAEPQLARQREEQERERQLLDRLWGIIEDVQPDTSIREALSGSGYVYDLIKLFNQKAGGDEERFRQLFGGGWAQAVMANDSFAEHKLRCNQGFIAKVLDIGGDTQMRARFVKVWRKRSRFHLGRLSFMAADDWFYRADFSLVYAETEYILNQLSAWRKYSPGKEFRIVADKRPGSYNDRYRLETRRTSPRR
ncbi:MAG TPA: hypothetical protein VFJ84_01810, partial [Candidatus Saccharimonadales bacterium]|nr:hypothetical protein [Candidatus Saccharimonadales bacterium]